MYLRPFVPIVNENNTVNKAVTATSQAIELADTGVGTRSILLTNDGTATIFVAFGTSSSVTADASKDMPVLAATQMIVLLKRNITYLGVIAAATGSTVYVTTGESE